jgi:hypothetical protein
MAEVISFTEGKFVESLELYTYRDGNVSYEKDKTTVSYKDGRTIVKNENNVTVYNDENEILTVINLIERPEIGLYFSLTKALFQKDFELLKENFKIEKIDKKTFEFNPKGDVEKFIEKLELNLDKDEVVKTLKLEFTNGDKIKIEAK